MKCCHYSLVLASLLTRRARIIFHMNSPSQSPSFKASLLLGTKAKTRATESPLKLNIAEICVQTSETHVTCIASSLRHTHIQPKVRIPVLEHENVAPAPRKLPDKECPAPALTPLVLTPLFTRRLAAQLLSHHALDFYWIYSI